MPSLDANIPTSRQPLAPLNMIDQKPSTYITSLFPGKKRVRASFAISAPREELVEAYDNDVARAIRSNDVAELRELLEEGRSFDGVNRNGESFLHLACRRGDLDVVEFLVREACVNTDVRDSMGRSVLFDVCWRPRLLESFEIMDTLLRVVSPELLIAEDIRGHSCFDYCRKENHGEWVTFLDKCSVLIQRRSKLVGLLRSDNLRE